MVRGTWYVVRGTWWKKGGEVDAEGMEGLRNETTAVRLPKQRTTMCRGEDDVWGNHAAAAEVELGLVAQGHEPWSFKRVRHLPSEEGRDRIVREMRAGERSAGLWACGPAGKRRGRPASVPHILPRF